MAISKINEAIAKSFSITYDEWEEKFKPLTNPNNGDSDLWETYGDDLKHVMKEAGKNLGTVWTLVDYEGDEEWEEIEGDDYEPQPMVIQSGYHLVNRVNYMITKVGLTDQDFLEILDR